MDQLKCDAINCVNTTVNAQSSGWTQFTVIQVNGQAPSNPFGQGESRKDFCSTAHAATFFTGEPT